MSNSDRLHVSLTELQSLSPAQLTLWQELRATNEALWSPFFDPRYAMMAARHAPRARVAVVQEGRVTVGFLPFQGHPGGLIRPLGAPLADQHGVISRPEGPDIKAVLGAMGSTSLRFTGLVGTHGLGASSVGHDVFLADLTGGLDAYQDARQASFPDHFKKMARRVRRAEREFGPVRVETGRRDKAMLETLIAWKRQKYRATGRHDILGVPWIVNFLNELLASNDPEFCGEISALWFGDTLAAIEFGMRGGDVLHSWFPSYDPQFSAVSPGVMLMDAMILQSGARGIRLVDLGSGHADYKKYVSNRVVEVVEGSIDGAGLRQWLTRPLTRLGSWVEQTNPVGLAHFPGKLSRRLEMILAAEPTLAGRARGILWAARDMAGRPG